MARGTWILALAAGGDARGVEIRQEPVVSACLKAAPNYVGSVRVSAWDARHRAAGVNVWIDPAMARILDGDGVSVKARLASRLSRWSTPNVPRVRAVVANTADADIRFVYGLKSPRSELDGTTTRVLVDGSFTTSARIELNTLEALGYPADAARDAVLLDTVVAAALHEFGHALGINGHSPSRRDLMFPDGSGEACGAACGPTPADKNTLSYLACRAIESGSGWARN